jgi:hypothetical protein
MDDATRAAMDEAARQGPGVGRLVIPLIPGVSEALPPGWTAEPLPQGYRWETDDEFRERLRVLAEEADNG